MKAATQKTSGVLKIKTADLEQTLAAVNVSWSHLVEATTGGDRIAHLRAHVRDLLAHLKTIEQHIQFPPVEPSHLVGNPVETP